MVKIQVYLLNWDTYNVDESVKAIETGLLLLLSQWLKASSSCDMQVMVNLHSAHMDPDDWQLPQQFRPERFLDESGNVIDRDRVIPFALGEYPLLMPAPTRRPSLPFRCCSCNLQKSLRRLDRSYIYSETHVYFCFFFWSQFPQIRADCHEKTR